MVHAPELFEIKKRWKMTGKRVGNIYTEKTFCLPLVFHPPNADIFLDRHLRFTDVWLGFKMVNMWEGSDFMFKVGIEFGVLTLAVLGSDISI